MSTLHLEHLLARQSVRGRCDDLLSILKAYIPAGENSPASKRNAYAPLQAVYLQWRHAQ
jgi:hypothetical protein